MSGTITRIFGDSIINAKTSKEDFDIIKHSGKEVRYKAEGKHIFEEWGGGGGGDLDYYFVPFIQIEKDNNIFKVSSQTEYKGLSMDIDEQKYVSKADSRLSFTKKSLKEKEILIKFFVRKGNKNADKTEGEILVRYTAKNGYTFPTNKKNILDTLEGIKKYDDPIEIKKSPDFFNAIQYIDFYFKKIIENKTNLNDKIITFENCGRIRIAGSYEIGTVVVVSGTDTKIEKDATKPEEFSWVMYKTSVYQNISLDTYKNLEANNKLPQPDYITYLSRDTHQVKDSKGNVLKHSNKRFGESNEIPPGDYFLLPGIPGQKYRIYVVDSESKSADTGDGIEGPDGTRGGVALHQYCPRFSVGCFTFNSGHDEQPIQHLIDNLLDFKTSRKPVRFIVKPRNVKESTWDSPSYGTKKWIGI